jgi:hypothetical protein
MSIKTYNISTLEHYLEFIWMKPLIILARKEIDLLEANIQGYTIGNFTESDKSADYLRDFGCFVLNKYGLKTNTEGWRNTILNKVNNDQEKAFEEFFRLFEQFKKKII